MKGSELKAWRIARSWKQSDLMEEMDVKARQTVVNWEKADKVPRLVELAIIALDQIPECNRVSGFERQYTREKIVNRWFDSTKTYSADVAGKASTAKV